MIAVLGAFIAGVLVGGIIGICVASMLQAAAAADAWHDRLERLGVTELAGELRPPEASKQSTVAPDPPADTRRKPDNT